MTTLPLHTMQSWNETPEEQYTREKENEEESETKLFKILKKWQEHDYFSWSSHAFIRLWPVMTPFVNVMSQQEPHIDNATVSRFLTQLALLVISEIYAGLEGEAVNGISNKIIEMGNVLRNKKSKNKFNTENNRTLFSLLYKTIAHNCIVQIYLPFGLLSLYKLWSNNQHNAA